MAEEEKKLEETLDELANEETPYGVPTTAQLNKINKFAKRKLSKEEVFVTSAKFIGDGLLEERAMKIDESLLSVFLKDAKSGIAFMLDHPWAWGSAKPAFPYGRTFDARLEQSEGNPEAADESKALYGDIYIVKGKAKDGISTDEIIKDIEDGTLFDVSIGFGFRTAECSICGESIWKCDHYPGVEYEVDKKKQLCYIIAKPPGYLMEISGVFDGAYPTAGFSQDSDFEPAWVEVEDIKEVPQDTELMYTYSNRFGFRAFRKNEPLAEEPKVVTPTIDVERAKEIAGANWQDNLFKLATEGKELRVDLIEDTVKWGVRAMGNAFDEELYRHLLEKSSITEIKRFRDQFSQKAKEEIPTGRKVQTPSTVLKEIPLGAYKRKE